MDAARFERITSTYPRIRIAVVGDFCLDRYLEIDPAREETSIETGLAVHNVVRVRPQPGGAGTVLNNLSALGIGTLHIVGLAGDDGEGFELRRELSRVTGARLDHFIQTPLRQTFTYCKPLVLKQGASPRELNRLDRKNWTPTPAELSLRLCDGLRSIWPDVDAVILLSQVDAPGTGVITRELLETVRDLTQRDPGKFVIADSRHSLRGFPPVTYKMNAVEFGELRGIAAGAAIEVFREAALGLARSLERPVIVSLSERGILGALPEGSCEHVTALPIRGEIDVVGAGDSVTANFTAAMAAGADLRESLELANAAGSVVIHQLGTTGVAPVAALRKTLFPFLKGG